jgi:hypothetical protein
VRVVRDLKLKEQKESTYVSKFCSSLAQNQIEKVHHMARVIEIDYSLIINILCGLFFRLFQSLR